MEDYVEALRTVLIGLIGVMALFGLVQVAFPSILWRLMILRGDAEPSLKNMALRRAYGLLLIGAAAIGWFWILPQLVIPE